MRKTIISQHATGEAPNAEWLNVEKIASVEVSSEQDEYPVENAFALHGAGWRAAAPGRQTIRLIFDQPQRVSRIWLRFFEQETDRTQEFTLKWSSKEGPAHESILRQQWTFSLSGSTTETEDYHVELNTVRVLELSINPDISNSGAFASLAGWRVA